MERETGFEPATLALARQCSTAELFPHMKIKDYNAKIYKLKLDMSNFVSNPVQMIRHAHHERVAKS